MKNTSVALCLALSVGGCAVGPNYRPVSPAALGVPDRYQLALPSPGTDLSNWWNRFDDPLLGQLIVRATADNLDIAQSAARLRQARELLVQSRADQLPNIAASGSVGRNVSTGISDTTSFSTRIDAQWSADLFGGLRRNAQAARANFEAAGFSLEDIKTAIAAEVARNYIDYRTALARAAIAQDTLKTQDDNLEITNFRQQAGLVSSLDVEQARAQRAATAAAIPNLERAAASARYRLAVLTGTAPGALDSVLSAPGSIPKADSVVATGIPADVLRQRPDIRAAERNLAADTTRIGIAQAQLYPSFTLTGNVGSSALSLRTLTDVITGGVFASLAQTIFDGGRLRSVVRQSRARADESFAAYKSSVLGALEDVENALVARETVVARLIALTEQVDASTNAAVLARSSYRAGLSDFRTLLEAERTLLSARDGLAAAQGDRATALVQLYLALGGGWSPDLPPITETANGR